MWTLYIQLYTSITDRHCMWVFHRHYIQVWHRHVFYTDKRDCLQTLYVDIICGCHMWGIQMNTAYRHCTQTFHMEIVHGPYVQTSYRRYRDVACGRYVSAVYGDTCIGIKHCRCLQICYVNLVHKPYRHFMQVLYIDTVYRHYKYVHRHCMETRYIHFVCRQYKYIETLQAGILQILCINIVHRRYIQLLYMRGLQTHIVHRHYQKHCMGTL